MNLYIATYNLYVGAVKRHPDKVLRDLEFLTSHNHIVLLQEAGQADKILSKADRLFGVSRWAGEGDATDHTQVMYRNSMNFRRGFSRPITGPTFVGPGGAGGHNGTVERKDLNVAVFGFNGRRINAASYHGVPSIYIPARAQLARKQVSRTAEIVDDMPGITIVGGDWNMEPDNDILKPMERAGMRSAQKRFGPMPTHGRRSIDDIRWSFNPEKVSPVKAETHPGVSDHDSFMVQMNVHSRKKRGTIKV
jgi:hypothetical protein